jgi:hypothetical protein
MTKTTIKDQSITLSLLLNILERLLVSLRDQNQCWLRNRDFAKEQLQEYAEDEYSQEECDIWGERIVYNEALLLSEELLTELAIALEKNPFPGQRLRVVAVASVLFPDAIVAFEPKLFLTGRKLWLRLFDETGLPYEAKVYFPLEMGDVNVVEIEEEMLRIAGSREELSVADVASVLHWEPRSKTYRTVKKELESRGWRWASKRVDGEKVKVIYPPSGTAI